jgi:hypothetical protein
MQALSTACQGYRFLRQNDEYKMMKNSVPDEGLSQGFVPSFCKHDFVSKLRYLNAGIEHRVPGIPFFETK